MRKLIGLWFICLLFVVGCVQLTPEQSKQMSDAKIGINNINAELAVLYPVAEDLINQLKDVYDRIAKGELPRDKGMKLIATIQAKKGTAMLSIQRGKAEIDRLTANIKALDDSGVPWWQIALGLVVPVITGASAFSKNRKLGAASRALGALSRAGTNTAGFGKVLQAELLNTPGVTVAETDEIWKLAKRGSI